MGFDLKEGGRGNKYCKKINLNQVCLPSVSPFGRDDDGVSHKRIQGRILEERDIDGNLSYKSAQFESGQ